MGQPVSGQSGIKVLVADDQRVNRLVLESFLRKEGHAVIVASDGAEAVELHRTEHPDLVLMDVEMPVMDGMEAARRIGADAGEGRTPLLFLTAVNDRQTMLEGLGLGDDFIQKPIDLETLRAKLRAFIRVVQAQRQLREQSQKIERLIDNMRRESEIAAYVLGRVLTHTEPSDGRNLEYRVTPSAMFSGDMVLARRTPGDRLHLLLADAVGHGLPAAINILPLFFPFDGMSRKGCSLATVARELNRRVRDLLPVDRFVAATLVDIDPESGDFEIWNGGNPPALVIDELGRVVTKIDSGHMALGLNEDNPALFETQAFSLRPRQRLLVCSDGIWENPAFGGTDAARAIADLVVADGGYGLDRLFGAAIEAGQSDDLSALLVGADGSGGPGHRPDAVRDRSLTSRLSLQFGPESLRSADAIESLLRMVGSLGWVDGFPALPAILGELFSNALDYGVLAMDGTAKHQADGRGREFHAERERRLAGLQDGLITVEIEPGVFAGRQVLRLTVADSGMGFDSEGTAMRAANEPGPAAERGLQRVRQLAASLVFNRQGSEVIALIAPRGGNPAGEQMP